MDYAKTIKRDLKKLNKFIFKKFKSMSGKTIDVGQTTWPGNLW